MVMDDTPSKVNMFANKPHDQHFKSCFFLSKGQERNSDEGVGREGEATFLVDDNKFIKKNLFPEDKQNFKRK